MKLSETPEELRDRQLKELQGKNVAYYSAMLSAWIQTKMEHDKTLVTISSAAIALLVTLGTVVGVRSACEIAVFMIGIISFIVCIGITLRVYQLNSKLIEQELRDDETKRPRLKRYDRFAWTMFLVGMVSLGVIGVVAVFNKYQEIRSRDMSNDRARQLIDTTPTEKRSMDGIGQLKPRPSEGEPAAPNKPAPVEQGQTNQEKS